MPESSERQMDRYLSGELNPAEARELAQAALDRPGLFDELTLAAVVKESLAGPAAKAMLESWPANTDESLKSYLSGRLAASQQRELGQAALDDDELFDALAAHGVVETSLRDPAFRTAAGASSSSTTALPKVVRFPRPMRAIVLVGSVAAAVALVAVYLTKTPSPSSEHQTASQSGAAHTLTPALDPASGLPVLLAADLRRANTETSPVFRSSEPESRAPQPNGTILALDNLAANIDLGSLDGLAKGTELGVYRGDGSKQPVGRLVVTTVFRDHARANIVAGVAMRARDQVRVDASVFLPAALQEIDSLVERGNLRKGREAAAKALAWAESAAVAPGQKRGVLEKLASLDYQTGDVASAERNYLSAIDTFGAPPAAPASEQGATLNSLGVLLLLRGDTTQAEARFREAQAKTVQGNVYARSLNNLGVVAESRGDERTARALYNDALRSLGAATGASPQDRSAIETNLARLAGRVNEQH
jgi:tetratricopeptide (TPR) repeat protein